MTDITLHRKFQDRMGHDWYVWRGTCVKPWIADEYSSIKRLTIPECAAEYWKFMGGTYTGHREKERERRATLLRFATLPHYDDVIA